MPALTRIVVPLIALIGLASVARGAPDPARVVLADSDPELLHAIEKALAPWHLVVVVDPVAPADALEAQDRAQAADAQFVVWRDRDQLVVFDRPRESTERRPTQAGAFDPVSAAEAALSVKTMMRLPGDSEQSPAHGIGFRIQPGFGVRANPGSDTGTQARGTLAVLVQPSRAYGWRIGLAVDLDTKTDLDRAGFKGTAGDWDVVAVASWAREFGPWAIEPWATAGVVRALLDGTEMMGTIRTERANLPMLGAGVAGRWRTGPFSVAGSVGAEISVGTPTYVRPGTSVELYSVPSFGIVAGIFAAADL